MYESLIVAPEPAATGGSPLDAALAAEGVTGKEAAFARSIYHQESSSGTNTTTSNRGAVGGMQIIPGTFAEVADKDWRIEDPVHNARAGVRYARKMWVAANGDPAIAAAGYYGGPGGLEKARRGVAVSDPVNPRAPNTLQYGAQVAGRMKTGDAPAAAPVAASAEPAGTYDGLVVKPGDDKASNYHEPVSGRYASLVVVPPPERTALESAKDSAVALGSGLAGGVSSIASVFGADNPVARGAADLAQDIEGQGSDFRKAQRAARAKLIAEAEESGSSWNEIVANLGALKDAPLDTMLNAIGSTAPTLLTAFIPGLGQANAARLVVQGAVGAAQGAGAVKGSIYEAVSKKLIEGGMSPSEAAKVAAGAQAYDSQNGGQIAGGAILGAIAGSSGAEAVAAKIVGKTGGAPGLARRVATTGGTETVTEAGQGGQERMAANVALQNEGFDVPTMQGVAGQAAIEGAAGGIMGGGLGAINTPAVPPALQPVADKAAEPDSPLSRAAMAGNTGPAAEAARAGAAQEQAAAEAEASKPDPLLERLSIVEATLRQPGAMDALRAKTSPSNPKEVMSDLATVQSPSARPAIREQAMARLEYALEWAGITPAPQAPSAGQQTVAAPNISELRDQADTAAGRSFAQPAPAPTSAPVASTFDTAPGAEQRATADAQLAAANDQAANAAAPLPQVDAVIDALRIEPALRTGPQATVVRQAQTRYTPEQWMMLEKAARYSAGLSATEKIQLAQLRGLANPAKAVGQETAAETATVGAKTAAVVDQKDAPVIDNAGSGSPVSVNEIPILGTDVPKTGIPAGPGTAAMRKRAATIRQVVDMGLTKVENRDDGFYLTDGKRTFKLDGPGDAALARKAVQDGVRAGATAANTAPTDGQKEAGNYKKGRVAFDGLKIGIENPIGSTRSGKSPDGTEWSVDMSADYGDITGTTGADGDGVDVYLAKDPRPGSPVFVFDQYNDDGKFDETKSVIGAPTEEAATRIYDAHFSDGSGPRRRRAVTQMTAEEFKAWAFSDAAKKPAGGDKSGKTGPAAGAVPAKRSGSAAADTAGGLGAGGVGADRADAGRANNAGAGPSGAGGDASAPAGARSKRTHVKVQFHGKTRELPIVDPENLTATSPARRGNAQQMTQGNAELIRALAAVFGKEVVIFESEDLGDGFVMPGVNSTIFLNEYTTIQPMAVFGHELMHLLQREHPAVHAALRSVVNARLKKKGAKGFRDDYSSTTKSTNTNEPLSSDELEELTSDLGGNLLSEKTFWKEVMDKIEKDHPTEGKTLVAQWAATIYSVIGKLVAAFKAMRQPGFNANAYVNDLKTIRAAYRDALAGYIADKHITRTSMQAQILREQQNDAKRSAARERGILDNTADERAEDDSASELGQEPGGATAQAPEYGKARKGAVSVLARHYGSAQRKELNSYAFGRGLKGAERERIQDADDSRLRDRISFYVDQGKGITPESGVGPYAHEVRLNNIYDPRTKLVATGGGNNAFESRVIDAGFDGYLNPEFTTQQGAVVLLGKHNVPVKFVGQPRADKVVDVSPTTTSRALMSKEIGKVDTSSIPGAKLANGTLTVPTESAAQANAEMERIGSTIRFSTKRAVQGVDEDGNPEFVGSDVYLGLAQPTERMEYIPQSDGERMMNMAVMAPNGDYLGYVELLFVDGKLSGLYDIEMVRRGEGDGRRVIEALLAANPGDNLHISNIVPQARSFWSSVGVPEQNLAEGEAYDGQLNWEKYAESSAGKKRGAGSLAARKASKDGGSNSANETGSDRAGARGAEDEVTRSTKRDILDDVRAAAEAAGVVIDVELSGEEDINLNYVERLDKSKKKKGAARQIIDKLLEIADDSGKYVRLTAINRQLANYWGTFGFEPDMGYEELDEDILMIREPEGDATLSTKRDVTETPAFKKWFGDSKVVDADGKPLVVYHGTVFDFDTFQKGREKGSGESMPSDRLGHFFTTSAEEASEYADRDGANVKPVYLTIKNPRLIGPSTWRKVANSAQAAGRLAAEANREGYDGFHIPGSSTDWWIAFRPEQIKSATGNDGTFSRDDADITRSTKRDSLRPEVVAAAGPAIRYLTPSERAKLRVDTATKLHDLFAEMPSANEMAAVAFAGKAKRGWYEQSARALMHVFGPDAPRFAALLAALSPQTSVEINLRNALATWKNWVRAGRPVQKDEIFQIMGRSVEGNKLTDSVLPAWVPNSVRALTAEDPESVILSGPKVNSFMLNLRGVTEEVTNDAWMANYAAVDQRIFSGGLNVAGTDPGKGPGYMAMSAKVRQAARKLSDLTGEDWTPAEVQETVWSWAKTLYELQDKDMGARELLDNEAVTDELIQSTPDFRTQLNEGRNEETLREAGYGEEIDSLRGRGADARPGDEKPAARVEAAPFDRDTQGRLLRKAASRLEDLKTARDAGAAETREANATLSTRRDPTNTPEFREWFGRSKVTESGRAGGKPLVLYHGTLEDFAEFDEDFQAPDAIWGPGFYFTSLPDQAADHADPQVTGANIRPVYLSLQNPAPRSVWKPLLNRVDAGKIDEVELREILEERGYDGIAAGEIDAIGERGYVAWHPQQIKSAISGFASAGAHDARSSEAHPPEEEILRSTARGTRDKDNNLAGLPTKVVVPGVGELKVGHWPEAAEVAKLYCEAAGLQYNPPNRFMKVDVERAKAIAAAYEAMKHDPEDYEVKKAYSALAREVIAQYQAVLKSGLKVEFLAPSPDGSFIDPYAASPRLAVEDMRKNNHLWVFPTTGGFGHEGSGNFGSFAPSTKPGSPEHVLATADVERFISSAKLARSGRKFGPVMGDLSAEVLRDARMFISEDGRSGFAIGPDGDLLNTFSSAKKRFGVLMEAARLNGVRKVDTLDTGIVEMYKSEGFVEVAREPWDDKYAPAGWSKDLGRPDHVYLEYRKPTAIRDTTHPLLADSGEMISGQRAVVNDLFRVVHDYFGHAKEGVGFRAVGEENAWRAHMAMFSPEAGRAMTTETRGQNSWVNYGSHGEKNRTASGSDTVYADQKTGLLPDWVNENGANDPAVIEKPTVTEAERALRASGIVQLPGAGEWQYDGDVMFKDFRVRGEDRAGEKRRAWFGAWGQASGDNMVVIEDEAGREVFQPALRRSTARDTNAVVANPKDVAGKEDGKRSAGGKTPSGMPTAKYDPQQPVYLRVGDWHESETSRNYAAGKTEIGVSVYDIRDGKPLTPEDGEWAEVDMRERLDSSDPKYLVQGEEQGTGHDGEPLLKRVRVVGYFHNGQLAFLNESSARSTARDVTATPEFKDWFGDSKVVDANGTPMVMYHGTSKDVDFKRFNIGQRGAWFTADPKGASMYATSNDSQKMVYEGGKFIDKNTASRVIPAYLSIQNPYTPTSDDERRLRTEGSYATVQRDIFSKARSAGHDGIDLGGGVWIAFKPEQIKSAIGNDGSFDRQNSDITRSPQRSAFNPGYNPKLARGVVLKPTAAEMKLLDEIAQARDAASALWGEAKKKIVDQKYKKLQATNLKSSADLDDETLRSLANQMFHHEQVAGTNKAAFAEYDKAQEGVRAMELRRLDMAAERIGPPEFEGMQQLEDFPRPQTETAEFKRWFGGSRVIAKNGRPLIAFHGTNRDITEFRTVSPRGDKQVSNNNWFGQLGAWFAAPSQDGSYEVGSAEATADVFAEMRGDEVDGVVYPVYLSIQNPYETEGYESIVEERDEAGGAKAFRDQLIASGYDGVVVRESSTDGGQYRDDWIAFHSSQIKSAIGNNGEFSDSGDITRSTARPVWYSQLEVALESVPDRLATMAAPQWKLWLDANAGKLGVKKDEIEWSGLPEYLKMRGKDKVSKDDLVAFVRDNGVQVEDVVLGGSASPKPPFTDAEAAIKFIAEFNETSVAQVREDYGYADDRDYIALASEAWRRNAAGVENAATKFDDPRYRLPGGENYREVLLTLPVKREERKIDRSEAEKLVHDENRFIYMRYPLDGGDFETERVFPSDFEGGLATSAVFYEMPGGIDAAQNAAFRDSHWEQPNVLAHMRVDDRTDADGKKVLFINEIQSDWGQKGRDKGFHKDSDKDLAQQASDDVRRLEDEHQRLSGEISVESGEYTDLMEDRRNGADVGSKIDASLDRLNTMRAERLAVGEQLNAAWQTLEAAQDDNKIPAGPFVDNTKHWVALALKRALTMAVEGDYDKVAWVRGEQAADFFDLSKQVNAIRLSKTGRLSVVRDGETGWHLVAESVADAKLEDYLGKEAAKRLLDRPLSDDGSRQMYGEDLKVGGDGMRAFYDKIVPQVANDVLKKLGGGKVGEVLIPISAKQQTLDVIGEDGDVILRTDHDSQAHAVARENPGSRVVPTPNIDSIPTQPAIDITPAMRDAAAGGMPLFSTAREIRGMDVGFGYKVSDLLDSSKKVSWWDKSVGTPYHLAEKHPTFKRVYDAVQSFISDVSKYATRAADLAPNILPKLEHLKDVWKSPLSAEDVEDLSDPIFKGTLVYTRDAAGDPVEAEDVGNAGIVWTPTELKTMWKLNDRQVDLYKEFRRATNKSIADLATTGMLRYAGPDAEGVRGRVLQATNVQQAAEILGDHLAWLAANDPQRANTLMNTARVIKEQADEARGLMARGYAPLSRYGDFTVYAPNLGENGYFEMFESEREANRRHRQLKAEFPGQNITVGTMSKEAHKLFKGVTPETLALFGDSLGLEESGSERESQVFQEYLKIAKSTRSAMKRLIKRKGVDGYSNDVGRVLAGFVYSNARQAGQNLNAGEILKSANEVPEGDLKDHAIKLVDYAQTPQEEAQAIRGLMFVQYIGGSVASAITNTTQSLTTTLPTLSMHFGIGKAAKAMGDAVVIASKGAGTDADLAAAMKRAEEEGITAPQETHQLMAQSQGKGSLKSGDGTAFGNNVAKLSNAWSKAMFGWGKMFSFAEVLNRKIAFAAAYKLARAAGSKDPYGFAKKIVSDTQYIMNKGNNPMWARGPVGATLFTFRKFMINYLEGLARMYGHGPEGKKAFALSLAILFLVAGTGGLPFADDLDDIVDGFAQRVLNKSFSSKQVRKEFFTGILGEAGANFVEKGLSGLPGVPIDFSGRLGLGNVAPGTGILTKKQSYGQDVAEIAGAAGDFAKRMLAGGAALAQGEVGAAAQQAAPIALANLYKGAEMHSLGYYKDAKNRKVIDVTAVEAALKAIGFQPASVDKIQDASRVQQSLIAQNKLRETEIADKWARGRYERKPELIEDAKRELRAWNESNPTSPITIDQGQINKRVQAAMMDKAQRLAKTAPKEIRKDVARELEAASQ
jgi:hypothetical protein